MYTMNITTAIKKININEICNIIFEIYSKGIGLSRENSYYSMKLLERKDLLFLQRN